MPHKALFYTRLEGDAVRCELCPHRCVVQSGGAGRCRVRKNEGGTLQATSYARTVSVAVDPVEKKPLYHFLPGREVVSVGHNGCNLACAFCQNHSISQSDCPSAELPVDKLVEICLQRRSPMVAFTYTEPVTWFEYVLDAARVLRRDGVRTIMVSNGYINPEPLEELIPHIDAWNIDLKSMDDAFYRNLCGASLEPVLETIRRVHGRCWLELTNLVVTGQNDSVDTTNRLIDFVAALDPGVPVHFSRYFPQYRLTAPATPETTLLGIYKRASKRLRYVYVGNMRTSGESDTRCPGCGALLVSRSGYSTRVAGLDGDTCLACGAQIEGVWR